jgi:hypothetical protein
MPDNPFAMNFMVTFRAPLVHGPVRLGALVQSHRKDWEIHRSLSRAVARRFPPVPRRIHRGMPEAEALSFPVSLKKSEYRHLLRLVMKGHSEPVRQQRTYQKSHLILGIFCGISIRSRFNIKAFCVHPIGQLRGQRLRLFTHNPVGEKDVGDQRKTGCLEMSTIGNIDVSRPPRKV